MGVRGGGVRHATVGSWAPRLLPLWGGGLLLGGAFARRRLRLRPHAGVRGLGFGLGGKKAGRVFVRVSAGCMPLLRDVRPWELRVAGCGVCLAGVQGLGMSFDTVGPIQHRVGVGGQVLVRSVYGLGSRA